MPWSNWESLGGVITAGPAVSSWAGERLDTFVKGADNALWHKWFAGGWSGWESLGGIIDGSPAAVSWSSGRIDAFGRGMDNALWHKWFAGGWSGWESLGGTITAGPAVSSWAPGRLDVFAKGADNALWHKWWDGSWHNWESLGGVIDNEPAAVSWSSGRIDVFARGMDNALWHKWFDGGWHNWESLGGTITAGPAASSWAPGRLDVFVKGADNALWHKWYAGGWSGWESLGGVIDNTPAAVSWSLGRIDVFARGMDNAMWHKWWTQTLPTVRLHIKVLSQPTRFTIDRMVDNMIDVYATFGIRVHRVSDEALNLPLLNDLDVGSCTMGNVTTEQTQLMANRNGVGDQRCSGVLRALDQSQLQRLRCPPAQSAVRGGGVDRERMDARARSRPRAGPRACHAYRQVDDGRWHQQHHQSSARSHRQRSANDEQQPVYPESRLTRTVRTRRRRCQSAMQN